MLGDFLEANGIKQVELADGITADRAQVNRWARDPESNPTMQRINDILGWLSKRLGRPVTYEESFAAGERSLPAAVNE